MITWFNYGGGLRLKGRTPHTDNSDISEELCREVMKKQGGFFCRWTTDFDCGYETAWWYCIKDIPVSLEQLTSKQRYRVNKGLKNFNVCKIEANELDAYLQAMYDTALDSFSEYPAKYRPKISENTYRKEHQEGIKKYDYWGVIDKESAALIGYSICKSEDDMAYLYVVKIRPGSLKREPNAALIYELCRYYINTKGKKYICDGERNIRHETNYQDFLVKTIGFRYAYCHLNIVYKPIVKLAVILLYPFRILLKKVGRHIPIIYNLYCLLQQEEYARTFRKKKSCKIY